MIDLGDVQLILDDEKYFSLNGDISCNRKYYTTDRLTSPPEVKFKTKMKFDSKLLVWMAVSQKAISSIYVNRSTIAIKQETYLRDCVRKRLSIVITRMIVFYFGQILLHHITQDKFKNFSRQITSNFVFSYETSFQSTEPKKWFCRRRFGLCIQGKNL